MKKLILPLLLLIGLNNCGFAQAPQAFKYQAVARNANGDVVTNQIIGLKLSILKGSASGSALYTETHAANAGAHGVFSVNVGEGLVQTGVFSAIDWGADDYWLRVEMDISGGTNYIAMGASQLLAVPYALHAETVADKDDADANPTNELQSLSKTGNVVSLSNGGGSFTDEVNDADASPTNELQSLSLNGTVISLTNGNSIDLAPVIPPGGTDDQNLSLNGTTLSIEDGNSVDLSILQDGVDDADANPTNELQSLSKTGNVVSLSNGGGSFTDEVNDADANPTNELQTLSLNGTEISLSNGNSIDLGPVIPPGGTDDQNLSLNGTALSIEDGNSVDLSVIQDGVNDADADPTNELQTLSLNGTEISLSNGNSIDLGPVIPSGGTDDQNLSLNGTTLSIEDGNSVDLSVIQDGVNDADADPTNELQNLSLNGNTLQISNGTSVDLSSYISPWQVVANGITYNNGITYTKSQQVDELVRVGNNMPYSSSLTDEGLTVDYANQDGTVASVDGSQLRFSVQSNDRKAVYTIDSAFLENDQIVPLYTSLRPASMELWNFETRNHLDHAFQIQQDKLTGQTMVTSPWFLSIDSTDQNAFMTQRQLSFQGDNPLLHFGKFSKDSLAFFKDNPGLLFDSYSSFNADKLKIENGIDLTELIGANLYMDNGLNKTWLSPFGLVNEEILSPTDFFTRFSLYPDSLTFWNETKWMNAWLGTVSNNKSGGLKLYTGVNDRLIAQLGDFNAGGGTTPQGKLTLFDSNGKQKAFIGVIQNQGHSTVESDDSYVTNSDGIVSAGSIETLVIGADTLSIFSDLLSAGVDTVANSGFVNIYANETGPLVIYEPKAGMNVDEFGDGRVFCNGSFKIKYNESSMYSTKLDYYGLALNDSLGWSAVNITRDFLLPHVGYIRSYGENHSVNFMAGPNWEDGASSGGLAQVFDSADLPKAGMSVDSYENGNMFIVNGENRILDNLGNRWAYSDKYGYRLMDTDTFNGFVASMYRFPGLDNTGTVFTAGQNGTLNTFIGHNLLSSNPNGPSRGYIAVADENSSQRAGLMINDAGQGLVFADVKNFRMDDPKDPSREIWYASLEGPEAAAYVRGTATLENGEAFVPFPEHFQSVANPSTMTVILTPMSADTYGLAVIEKTADGIKVKELKGGTGEFSFDWEVKCVRAGFEGYQPVRQKLERRVEVNLPKSESGINE